MRFVSVLIVVEMLHATCMGLVACALKYSYSLKKGGFLITLVESFQQIIKSEIIHITNSKMDVTLSALFSLCMNFFLLIFVWVGDMITERIVQRLINYSVIIIS